MSAVYFYAAVAASLVTGVTLGWALSATGRRAATVATLMENGRVLLARLVTLLLVPVTAVFMLVSKLAEGIADALIALEDLMLRRR